MKSIKLLSCILSCIVFSLNSSAQLFTKPNPALHLAMQKVINDVPNHMENLLGEIISETVMSTTYDCKLQIPGALNTSVTGYTSTKDKSRSLKATILETENFDEAKKKYNELVNQLKAGKYTLPGEKTVLKWDVNYDKPGENKNFAGSIFRPAGMNGELKNLKLEVALNAQITSYTVKLLVYQKVEDDEVETADLSRE